MAAKPTSFTADDAGSDEDAAVPDMKGIAEEDDDDESAVAPREAPNPYGVSASSAAAATKPPGDPKASHAEVRSARNKTPPRPPPSSKEKSHVLLRLPSLFPSSHALLAPQQVARARSGNRTCRF